MTSKIRQTLTAVRSNRGLAFAAAVATIIALSVQFFPASTVAGGYKTAIRKESEPTNSTYRKHETPGGPAQEQVDNRAFPHSSIAYAQVVGAQRAFAAIPGPTLSQSWLEVGPVHPKVVGQATYTGRDTTNSGRITALAVGPTCNPTTCRIWVGAAGGGVWRSDRGLGAQPIWVPSSNGLTSNAIGSLLVDPSDPTGNTLYAGTGEPNGSNDSEAGVGLFKSTNGGQTWSLLTGSVAAAYNRSIAGIAIDPANPQHIVIGTAVARHGASSVWGGRHTPPDAPTLGIYDSTNGGNTFTLKFNLPQDTVFPENPSQINYFRGGVSKVEFDRTGLTSGQPSRVFASFFDYGLYRSIDGGNTYQQIFASAGGGNPANSAGARTEFDLAPLPNGHLRAYVGDTDGNNPADFYRSDNADAAAPAFVKLSDPAKGTPGFDSYDFCQGQCSYDMVVAVPKGHPNNVWLAGSEQYNELFGPSNGRAVLRSVDAGVHFTDMTEDSQVGPCRPFPNNVPPCPEGLHPDHHAIVFDPQNPDIAFDGNDGGIYRTDGTFTNLSSRCDTRNLSGVDLQDCHHWLSVAPTYLYAQNDTLRTMQFQSLSLNPRNPLYDVLGGTQDNGTWTFSGSTTWAESIGGDGGQSGTNPGNGNIKMSNYYDATPKVNFNGSDPNGWDVVYQPLFNSSENRSFYIPFIADPTVADSWFAGLQHVWRTQDNGGPQSYLDSSACNTILNPNNPAADCGDWVQIGQDLTSPDYGDRVDPCGAGCDFVTVDQRTTGDANTMWAATRVGRIWMSHNANASNPASVTFTRLDDKPSNGVRPPERFPSGIAIDPSNTNHAWVSYSGYDAYQCCGHVFDALYNPVTGLTTWTDISHNLGDQPVTDIVHDDKTGDLYISNDFGVLRLPNGSSTWQQAANGLPPTAVFGLTISQDHRVLYAATHGRGAFRLYLP